MTKTYNLYNLEAPFKEYLLAGNQKAVSIRNYLSDFRHFAGWVVGNDLRVVPESVGHDGPTLQHINTSTISEYKLYLESNDIPHKTINRRLSTLRKFCSFCISQGWMKENPAKQISNISLSSIIYHPGSNKAPESPKESLISKIKSQISKLHIKNQKEKPPLSSRIYDPGSNLGFQQYIALIIILIFVSVMGAGIYNQFFINNRQSLAYPTSLTRAGRILSFQGRLTDTLSNPITTATNVRFQLYSVSSGGTALYDTGACSITPDQDGIFNSLIGSSCGSEISSAVFSENTNVYLGVTVASDAEMTPRQQIANVGYAINSETLQGLPPGTNISNIPYINSQGNLLIAASNPSLASTYASSTFTISSAQATTIQAAGAGDIVLQATESGTLKFRTGGTTDANTRMTIDNTGLVGIGDTTPDAPLDVVGDVYISDGLSLYETAVSDGTVEATKYCTGDGETNCVTDFSSLVAGAGYWTRTTGNLYPTNLNDTISATTSAAVALTLTQTGAFNALLVEDQASDPTPFVIDQSGNVGIGTTAPSTPFEVYKDNPELASFIRPVTTSAAYSGIALGQLNASSTKVQLATIYSLSTATTAGLEAGDMIFGTRSAGTGSIEKMRILGTGEVGIGTTGPDAKLDSLSTTEQLRLTYTDGSVYSSHTVDGSGNLTIDNTGTKTVIADDLQITGGDILDSNGNESIRFGTTASAVDEATLTNAAANGTVTFAATGGDTDIAFSIDSKGADALNLNGTATGDINLAGGSGSTGCTITNSTGALVCSGAISTTATTGTQGWWTRTTGNLSPANLNDTISATTSAAIAMTLTQTGAFNALLVEDQASDPTPFVIDQSGNVGIGDPSPDAKLDIDSDSTTGGDFLITNTGVGLSGTVAGVTANSVTTGDILTLSGTGLTTGSELVITGPSGGTAGVTDAAIKLTSDVGNIGTSNGLISSTATFDGSTATGINLYLSSTDAVVSGNTDYGIYNTISNTGAITTQTKNVYGTYTSVTGTGGTTTTPTTNVYGNYITTTATHATDVGTVNQYGLYIANGTSSTNGTSKKYGLYVESPTGADTNYAAIFEGGTVGIGTTAPNTTYGLDVADSDGIFVSKLIDREGSTYYVDPADGTLGLKTASSIEVGSNITVSGGVVDTGSSTTLILRSTGSTSVCIDTGASDCTGKIDAGTVDPPYTINGKNYATYMSAMTGVKEETTGIITTYQIKNPGSSNIQDPGSSIYGYTIDFANEPEASDLWLFAKTTDLKKQIDQMTVLLTPSENTRSWYKVDKDNLKLYIYSSRPTNISYRLTAPRFDSVNWNNRRPDDAHAGFVINDQGNITGPSNISYNQAEISPKNFVYDGNLENFRQSNSLYTLTGDFVDEFTSVTQALVARIKAGFIEAENIIVNQTLVAKKIASPVVQVSEIKPETKDITIDLSHESNVSNESNESNESNKGSLAKLIIKGLEGKTAVVIDEAGNASFSGQIIADSLSVNNDASISGTLTADLINAKNIDDLSNQVASSSSNLADQESKIQDLGSNINDIQTLLADIKNQPIPNLANETNLSNVSNLESLTVTGNSNLYNVSVSGSFLAGTILIDQSSIISLDSELKLSSLSTINLFDGAVIIAKDGKITTHGEIIAEKGIRTDEIKPLTKDGHVSINNLAIDNLTINNISTNSAIIAAPDNFIENGIFSPALETATASAGLGILPENSNEVIIYNENIKESSLIYLTPTSSVTSVSQLIVGEKNTGVKPYFKVVSNTPSTLPLKFNWLIIN